MLRALVGWRAGDRSIEKRSFLIYVIHHIIIIIMPAMRAFESALRGVG